MRLKSRHIRNSPVGSTGLVSTTTDNAEETVFTPVSAPTVAANPVVHTVLSAPAIELNSVVGGAGVAGIVHVDAAGVILNAIGIDVCRHWPTAEDLGHDIIIALDGAILRHGDLGVVSDGIYTINIVCTTQKSVFIVKWR